MFCCTTVVCKNKLTTNTLRVSHPRKHGQRDLILLPETEITNQQMDRIKHSNINYRKNDRHIQTPTPRRTTHARFTVTTDVVRQQIKCIVLYLKRFFQSKNK